MFVLHRALSGLMWKQYKNRDIFSVFLLLVIVLNIHGPFAYRWVTDCWCSCPAMFPCVVSTVWQWTLLFLFILTTYSSVALPPLTKVTSSLCVRWPLGILLWPWPWWTSCCILSGPCRGSCLRGCIRWLGPQALREETISKGVCTAFPEMMPVPKGFQPVSGWTCLSSVIDSAGDR